MASKRNGTLYIGVTSDLVARVQQHKEGRGSEFVKKYGVTILVWFEEHALIANAIQRETSIKRWPRKWKLALIEKDNPDWRDLYETLGGVGTLSLPTKPGLDDKELKWTWPEFRPGHVEINLNNSKSCLSCTRSLSRRCCTSCRCHCARA